MDSNAVANIPVGIIIPANADLKLIIFDFPSIRPLGQQQTRVQQGDTLYRVL
ncbi:MULTISPECIES: hypothetical protein [Citrobacter]|jgi:hypothetical protein|uniref:Uncharacterized protein n=1 Tax=Citrobacter amalonaticus TaxID=35703 RepID=A0A9C7V235_CITAM|nr:MULTISPECIES: hypothetical protein [Citrobacter]MEB2753792.1 hypothetical protein [Citrobacter freundii]HCD1254916.1 hypothetical protein [Citrobacter amalonaticus]MBA7945568.1 hypothetical protein [Citrobacter sp. RHBSTW-00271]UUX56955.1 hypothetical protein NUG39_25025 [Citrobacter youngae]WOR27761.1 hypothetical protein R2X23_25870 [Citrobacter braakii]